MITGINLVKLGMPHRLSLVEIQDIAYKAFKDPDLQVAFATQICKEASAHFHFQQTLNLDAEEALERVAYFSWLEEQENADATSSRLAPSEVATQFDAQQAPAVLDTPVAEPICVIRSLDPLLSRVETNIEKARILRENTRRAIELVRKSIALSDKATKRPFTLKEERFVGFDYYDFVTSSEASC